MVNHFTENMGYQLTILPVKGARCQSKKWSFSSKLQILCIWLFVRFFIFFCTIIYFYRGKYDGLATNEKELLFE